VQVGSPGGPEGSDHPRSFGAVDAGWAATNQGHPHSARFARVVEFPHRLNSSTRLTDNWIMPASSGWGNPIALLLIGIGLLALAPIYYWIEPALRRSITRVVFFGRQPPGGRLNQVGGSIMLVALGLFCVAGAIYQLTGGR